MSGAIPGPTRASMTISSAAVVSNLRLLDALRSSPRVALGPTARLFALSANSWNASMAARPATMVWMCILYSMREDPKVAESMGEKCVPTLSGSTPSINPLLGVNSYGPVSRCEPDARRLCTPSHLLNNERGLVRSDPTRRPSSSGCIDLRNRMREYGHCLAASRAITPQGPEIPV